MIFNQNTVAVTWGILIWSCICVFFLLIWQEEYEFLEIKPIYIEEAGKTTESSKTPKFSYSGQREWPKQTRQQHFVVPNVVHFIRFGKSNLTFIDAVCILAALKNQKPEKLIIHSDQISFQGGVYWDAITDHPMAGVIEIRYLSQPKKIFDQPLSPDYAIYHAGDIARLMVLMSYGGIYLDNDSYIVRSLDEFRHYEITLGHENGWMIANQVIIANKDARFLKIWYDSYRDYRPSWWYNAGQLPTELFYRQPYLINSVTKQLAERGNMSEIVYLERSEAWKSHYAIHLNIRHFYMIPRNVSENATYPVEFNETNILKYNVNIKDMALDVYRFKSPKPS